MKRQLLVVVAVLCSCSVGPRLPELPERGELPVPLSVDSAYEDVLTHPADADANGELGMLLHRLDDFQHAETLYRRASTLAPEEFRWPYYLATVEVALDQYDPAAPRLLRALSIDPGYLPAKLLLAQTYFRMGNLVGCEQTARELMDSESAGAGGDYWVGKVELENGRPAAAIERFRSACERYPEFGSAHWYWALAASQLRQEEVTREHFIEADRHRYQSPPLADPMLEEVRRGPARSADLVREAYLLENQGKLASAEKGYRAALRMDPHNDDAHARLVFVLNLTGDAKRAVEHYRQATQLNPNQDDAYAGYGILLLGEERFQEARAAFGQALHINPFHPEALSNLATMVASDRNPAEAERLLRMALDCRPDYREARIALGGLLVGERRYAEAFRELDAVIRVEDEKSPALLYEMSGYYMKAGSHEKAWACVRAAHQLAKKYGQVQLMDRIERERRVY